MDGTTANLLPNVMERLQRLAPIVDRPRAEFDSLHQLSKPVADAMVEADLFRLWTPRALGGA